MIADVLLTDAKNLYLREVVLRIVSLDGTITVVDGLRIRFDVEKNQESNPNPATIEIYNMGERTRSLLEERGLSERQRVGVLLDVGYAGVTATVFKGSIDSVNHDWQRTDLITKILAEDGGNVFRNAKTNRSFPAGVKFSDVVKSVAGDLGLPLSSLSGISDRQFANGYVANGLASDVLDSLTKQDKLEWSIQDETVQIIPQEVNVADEIIVIDTDTGLVGSPSKTDDGIQFTSLLQPKLRPGREVRLQSRDFSQKDTGFKIRRVVHSGDSYTGTFLSKCEAV